MTADAAARQHGMSRMAVGTALALRPGRATPWLADPSASTALRLLGIRDLVPGVLLAT